MKEEKKDYALIVTSSSKGHKCNEKKWFYIYCEEEEPKEEEASQEEVTSKEIEEDTSEEITPTISCHALAGISIPQTLKIEGSINKEKAIVLIGSGSTHNFIHYKLAKVLNCFVYPKPEFQVMIADGGTLNFSRKFHNINVYGEYVLNIPMISIPMGGVDVVLGFQWLQMIGNSVF